MRVSLSEEYFFRPLFDWHQERGLLSHRRGSIRAGLFGPVRLLFD